MPPSPFAGHVAHILLPPSLPLPTNREDEQPVLGVRSPPQGVDTAGLLLSPTRKGRVTSGFGSGFDLGEGRREPLQEETVPVQTLSQPPPTPPAPTSSVPPPIPSPASSAAPTAPPALPPVLPRPVSAASDGEGGMGAGVRGGAARVLLQRAGEISAIKGGDNDSSGGGGSLSPRPGAGGGGLSPRASFRGSILSPRPGLGGSARVLFRRAGESVTGKSSADPGSGAGASVTAVVGGGGGDGGYSGGGGSDDGGSRTGGERGGGGVGDGGVGVIEAGAVAADDSKSGDNVVGVDAGGSGGSGGSDRGDETSFNKDKDRAETTRPSQQYHPQGQDVLISVDDSVSSASSPSGPAAGGGIGGGTGPNTPRRPNSRGWPMSTAGPAEAASHTLPQSVRWNSTDTAPDSSVGGDSSPATAAAGAGAGAGGYQISPDADGEPCWDDDTGWNELRSTRAGLGIGGYDLENSELHDDGTTAMFGGVVGAVGGGGGGKDVASYVQWGVEGGVWYADGRLHRNHGDSGVGGGGGIDGFDGHGVDGHDGQWGVEHELVGWEEIGGGGEAGEEGSKESSARWSVASEDDGSGMRPAEALGKGLEEHLPFMVTYTLVKILRDPLLSVHYKVWTCFAFSLMTRRERRGMMFFLLL